VTIINGIPSLHRFTAEDIKTKWYGLTRSYRRLKDRKLANQKTYDWPYYDMLRDCLDKVHGGGVGVVSASRVEGGGGVAMEGESHLVIAWL